MPITPVDVERIVGVLEQEPWVQELKDALPDLRELAGVDDDPSSISVVQPPSGSPVGIPPEFSSKGATRMSHHKHQHRQHGKSHRKTADGRIIISPERYARKKGRRVKVLANETCARGGHIPFADLNRLADEWMQTGEKPSVERIDVEAAKHSHGRQRYDAAGLYGQQRPAFTPAIGSATGTYTGPTFSAPPRGSVGAPYVSSNRGTDGKIPTGASAYGDVELIKLNGRLRRLEADADRLRFMRQQGTITYEENKLLIELERGIEEAKMERFREGLLEAGSENSRRLNEAIVRYVTEHPGTSYDTAKRVLMGH
jgi:hypothetical protein